MKRAACAGGAIALAVLLAAGFAIALATPDSGLLGLTGRGAGTVREALRDAVGATGARYGTLAILPMLFVVLPIGACALGARVAARAAPRDGARAALASAIPFTAGLVVIALLSRGYFRTAGGSALHADPAIDSVVVHGAVWGALGAVLATGAWRRLGRRALGAVRALARPLAAVLAFLALTGVVFYEVSAIRGDLFGRLSRPEGVAVVENALFAGEHAVNFAGLGVLARFSALPAPLSDAEAVRVRPHAVNAAGHLSIHLPDYRHGYSTFLFAVLVACTVVVPFLAAAWAGGALARHTGSAAWGAAVGPAWAIALSGLWLLAYDRGGLPAGDLFLGVLVGGIVAGALGGLLARRSSLRAA